MKSNGRYCSLKISDLFFCYCCFQVQTFFRKPWDWLRDTWVTLLYLLRSWCFLGVLYVTVFAVCTEANWPCTAVIEHCESCWLCLLWNVHIYFLVSIWGCILNHILDIIFKGSLVSTNLSSHSFQGRKWKQTPATCPLILSCSGGTLPVKTMPSKCLFPLQ